MLAITPQRSDSLSHLSRPRLPEQAEPLPAIYLAAGLTSPGAILDKWKKPLPPGPQRPTPSPRNMRRHDSMLTAKGRESRRERTFVGAECAVCEEPLEHTLRGERVLQLSCGHVSHQACLYEYTKELDAHECPTCNAPLRLDPSRGAPADFENFNKLIRSGPAAEPRENGRDAQPTPTPSSWNPKCFVQDLQPPALSPRKVQHAEPEPFPPRRARTPQSRRVGPHANGHQRDGSGGAAQTSDTDFGETQVSSNGRRHDYDVQSMETSLSAPRNPTRNPIPPPIVTVRSEFPTLSKSKQQQSLTCLVTVEVLDGKWQANPDDLGSPPPPQPRPSNENVRARSCEQARSTVPPPRERASTPQQESSKLMEALKEDLFRRVDNWHGLDYSRFGRLLLHGTMRVGKDRQAWQELECYLFTEMLICIKEKKPPANASQQWTGSGEAMPKPRCALKGSILIKKHLQRVEVFAGMDSTFCRAANAH